MDLTVIAIIGVAVIVFGVIPAIYKAIAENARQTQILAAAIANLKPMASDPDEKPADMPYEMWLDVQRSDEEWKREEESKAYAKHRKTAAEAALAAAHKIKVGRKAAIVRAEADLAAIVTQEAERQKEREASLAASHERLLAGWKAQPYQLWRRDRWGSGERPWLCNGGWRDLADAVARMEYLARPDCYSKYGLELEIRSNGGAVLYRYSSEEEAKKRAAKWLPNA
jgi:hypothetical protein